jgi:uncharacterized membrane-anchored protein YjiN (DUF445 family)
MSQSVLLPAGTGRLPDGPAGMDGRRLSRMRLVAHVLLAGMAAGFVLLEILAWRGVLASRWWQLVITALEAGTVGALADWYAVTALFREVRLPLLRWRVPLLWRHSNIIIRNRRRITDNIAEMVQNRWLSPGALHQQLEKLAPVDAIMDWLDQPANIAKVLRRIRSMANLDPGSPYMEQIVSFLERAIQDQFRDVEFAQPLGGWIKGAVERGDQRRAWKALFDTAGSTLMDREFQLWLAPKLEMAVRQYASNSWKRRIARWIGETTGVINYRELARRVAEKASELLGTIEHSPDHPVRRKLDEALLEFASRLADGDPEAVGFVTYVWERVVDNAQLHDLVARVVRNFTDTVARQAGTPHSPLREAVRSYLSGRIQELRSDDARRAKWNRWIVESVTAMVDRNRDIIGATVRKNLEDLTDYQWGDQIEQKVGDDLQWIRINGAVVGSAVGLLLGAVKCLLAG